jgi:hypothetical protein
MQQESPGFKACFKSADKTLSALFSFPVIKFV